IDGKYPPQTSAERLSDQIQKDEKDELTNAQTAFKRNLDLISTAMNPLKLSNTTKTDIEKVAQHLNENGLSPYPQKENTNNTLNTTVDFLNEMLENLKKFEYDKCIEMLNRKDLRNDWQLCFAKYIEEQKELKRPILTQWHKFSGQISSITDSARLKPARGDTLKHKAFKKLNDAFELLGKALDETGKDKADKLEAAKEAITGDIEVGSEKIAKSEIKKIFDEIAKIPAPEKQWEKFCGSASNITNSNTLTWYINHYLIDKAFKDLDDAFKLLGDALNKKDEKERETELNKAKEQIPGEIKAGEKEIKKEEIAEIFDEIVEIPAPEEQWKTFCGCASNIDNSKTLTGAIEYFLIDEAFEALKGAFDLLGKALDEKGEEKKTKLGKAKKQIPAQIEAGSKKIEKREIEDIFDKIMKQKGPDVSSDTGTGKEFPTGQSGLPFDINTPPKTEAMKSSEDRDKKGSADKAQTKWHTGTTPKTRQKQDKTYLRQAETDRKQAEK
ncbi:MAG: hypothetical protein ACI4PJ_03480, partial [Acutalibacteraceae bacterium]